MTTARAIALTLRHQAGIDKLPQTYLSLLDRLLEELSTPAIPAQRSQEIVHVIDEADYPPPDSGFAKL